MTPRPGRTVRRTRSRFLRAGRLSGRLTPCAAETQTGEDRAGPSGLPRGVTTRHRPRRACEFGPASPGRARESTCIHRAGLEHSAVAQRAASWAVVHRCSGMPCAAAEPVRASAGCRLDSPPLVAGVLRPRRARRGRLARPPRRRPRPTARSTGTGRWRAPAAGARPQVLRGLRPAAPALAAGAPRRRPRPVAGALVRAAGAGAVTFAGPLAGQGSSRCRTPTLRTTYEPVDALAARRRSGSATSWAARAAHRHCGRTCLHWGVRRGETYLDPLSLVDRRRRAAAVRTPLGAVPRCAGSGRARPNVDLGEVLDRGERVVEGVQQRDHSG